MRKRCTRLAAALVVTAQRSLYGGDRVVIVDRQLNGRARCGPSAPLPALNRLAVQHDVALMLAQ